MEGIRAAHPPIVVRGIFRGSGQTIDSNIRPPRPIRMNLEPIIANLVQLIPATEVLHNRNRSLEGINTALAASGDRYISVVGTRRQLLRRVCCDLDPQGQCDRVLDITDRRFRPSCDGTCR